ncbi:MAG TPA: hypothetical protein VKD72_38165 [Gemmataceae bacterium]|nr:hypothetical protein [Gemmataceae bacterium]
MKTVLAGMLSLMLATAAWAANDSVVHWKDIVGVITALNVDQPVGDNIHSGTFAWSTRSGHATVNLETGKTTFDVQGLNINGTVFSGTPGPVTAVTGTLVCNAGDQGTEAILDTAEAPLSAQGAAHFTGIIRGIPAPCTNPLFLIRIANPVQAAGLWIATGHERTGGN